MPSIPGHVNRAEFIGDVASIHYGIGGAIAAVLLMVDCDGQPLHLALLSSQVSQWPPGLAKSDRVWVKGVLRLEARVWHKKNSHYLEISHIERIRGPLRGSASR